jgi:DNA-binding transcriptional MerR regulator
MSILWKKTIIKFKIKKIGELIMERSKNVKIILLAAVLALMTLSSNLFAQGYWCNDNNYGMNWWNTNLPSQYNLSSDQVAELNEYRADSDQKIRPLQKELRALQIEMRGYIYRNDADPATIKEYRNQIRDLQDKIAEIP